MTATPDDLFAYLDELGIAHTTHWHPPVFTVEEGRDLKASMPGGHTKNLFLTDKDGAIILIAAEAHSQLKLNRLHVLCGAKWAGSAHHDVSFSRAHTQTPQLICVSIRCDSEEPSTARSEKTLRAKKILQLRSSLFELQQHFIRARPCGQQNTLWPVQAATAREWSARRSCNSAPRPG